MLRGFIEILEKVSDGSAINVPHLESTHLWWFGHMQRRPLGGLGKLNPKSDENRRTRSKTKATFKFDLAL